MNIHAIGEADAAAGNRGRDECCCILTRQGFGGPSTPSDRRTYYDPDELRLFVRDAVAPDAE